MATTVTAWASRLLHSEALPDKLARPGPLVDDAPGPALVADLDAPARPAHLRFATHTWRAPRFDTEAGRAAVLHAFANHELLAIELMALALLRFPDAPAALRADVVRTITEEQRHLRAYLLRMDELGVAFGSLPVNGWFWRRLADMRTPMDLIARMSLTFEAANLDHATWYRDRFAEAGDAQTAAVLEMVLRDEIAHVATGVRWLDVLRGPQTTPFSAWSAALPPELSPARARGPVFCAGPRRAAGMDEATIAAIEAVPWSRGRTVTVWTVNLAAEAELAHETLPAAVRRRLDDLASSVAFVADEGDVVHLPRPDTGALRTAWLEAGVRLPHMVWTADAATAPAVPGPSRPDAWARTPAWRARHGTSNGGSEQAPAWFSKASAVPLAARLAAELSTLQGAIGPSWTQGCVVHSVEDLRAACGVWCAHGVTQVVVKKPLSAAGGGMRRLPCVEVAQGAPVPQWVPRSFAQQGALVAEPWLDRVFDLSLLLDLDAGSAAVRRPVVSRSGRYHGHWLGDPWRGLASPVRRSVFQRTSGVDLRTAAEAAAAWLVTVLRELGLHGRVGVDAFVWRDPSGDLWLRPLVELNPRLTMGHVALSLERHLHPGVAALWAHAPVGAAPQAAEQLLTGLRADLPMELDPRTGRIAQGALATTDPTTCEEVLAVLLVAPSPAAMAGALERLAASGVDARVSSPRES